MTATLTTHTRNAKADLVQQDYDPGSFLEHLLYAIGTITVLTGPLLIPGLTFKLWTMGFFGAVIGFYILVCLLGIWKSLRGYRHIKR